MCSFTLQEGGKVSGARLQKNQNQYGCGKWREGVAADFEEFEKVLHCTRWWIRCPSNQFYIFILIHDLYAGRKKVHYILHEGKEMVEEYDVNNGQILGTLKYLWYDNQVLYLILYFQECNIVPCMLSIHSCNVQYCCASNVSWHLAHFHDLQ